MPGPTQDMYVNFFRYLKDKSKTMAIDLMNAELDYEFEWDKLFELDEEGMGFNLEAEEIGDNTFSISFDCKVEEGVGDGGIWEVKFDDLGNVLECECVHEFTQAEK